EARRSRSHHTQIDHPDKDQDRHPQRNEICAEQVGLTCRRDTPTPAHPGSAALDRCHESAHSKDQADSAKRNQEEATYLVAPSVLSPCSSRCPRARLTG